jgi:hypothetical protein
MLDFAFTSEFDARAITRPAHEAKITVPAKAADAIVDDAADSILRHARDPMSLRPFAGALDFFVQLSREVNIELSGGSDFGFSKPGHPPFTANIPGKNLPDAIGYTVLEDGTAAIGTDNSIGTVGELMEFGGRRFNANYEPRPYIQPAVERNLDAYADGFKGSI